MDLAREEGAGMIEWLDTFFLALVLLSAVATLALRDLLAAVIVFGAFSFFSAMFFTSLGALDVAFTEAAVGAAITAVIFVIVILRTERRSQPRPLPRGAHLATIIALALGGLGLLQAAAGLPAVGDPESPPARHISPRYVESGPAETGAPNMVTAVLVDYRGYDTLGETLVIFGAGLACLLVLAGRRERGERGPTVNVPFGSPVLDAAARLLTPFILLFAAYVIVHGHYGPGGGFQGGVIMAAALILVRLVRGHRQSWGLSPAASLCLASGGVVAFTAIGLLGLAFGGNFLDYGVLPLPLEAGQVRAVSTFGIELGVGLGVTGAVVLIFESLIAREEAES